MYAGVEPSHRFMSYLSALPTEGKTAFRGGPRYELDQIVLLLKKGNGPQDFSDNRDVDMALF